MGKLQSSALFCNVQDTSRYEGTANLTHHHAVYSCLSPVHLFGSCVMTEKELFIRVFACRDALLKDKRQVRIDLTDIKSFDHELGFLLGNDPTQYLPLVRSHILARWRIGFSRSVARWNYVVLTYLECELPQISLAENQ